MDGQNEEGNSGINGIEEFKIRGLYNRGLPKGTDGILEHREKTLKENRN
jgi:hypothetical protein